ncbi:hypothetical protein KFE25_001563 [Diacronema lutheri]|uniref:PH domain-containing protein n=2 Tax=Diacronema lutheri TaxID=2081491 RepID=A0A8J6C4F5_DIALT|nr:hypothetical protein KFE25_001563 [Diacronema lutheri]
MRASSGAAGPAQELEAAAEPHVDVSPITQSSWTPLWRQRVRRGAPLAVLFAAAVALVVVEPLQTILFSALGALVLVAVLYTMYLAATDPRRLARETAHVSTRVVSHVETFRETIAAEHRRAEEARKPRALSDTQALLQGASFTKYGRAGAPHLRWVWLRLRGSALELCWAESARSRAAPTVLLVVDITDVVEGRHTEVFQRQRLNLQGEERCFSVVTHARTLDLEAADLPTAQLWVATLRELVKKQQRTAAASVTGPHSPQQELLPVSSTMSSER